MKRAPWLALVAIAALVGGFHEWTVPAHAAAQPTKIAYIEFENQKASTVYDATNMPYFNNTVIPLGIKFTGFHEGTDTHTNPTGSAEQYTYQTSGDNCGGASVDSYWNSGSNNPISSGSGNTCGLDLFAYLTANSISWTAYNEYYVAGSTGCTTAFTDSSVHKQYARKHNPSLFYNDVVASPYTSCPNTVGFPQNNTGHAVSQNFTGNETFSKFNFIVPGLCHDQHTAATDCQSGTPPATTDYFNGDGNTSSPCGGAALTNKVKAGDCWLQLNFNAIREDVGVGGVVLISWDEGTDSTTQELIGMVAVPGCPSEGCVPEHGVLASCPAGGCTDSTSNTYDQVSVLRTVANALTGTACYTGLNTSAASDCTGSATLPVTVTDVPVQGVAADNGSSTTTVSASWPATPTTGNFLVAAVSAKGSVTSITAPSGWTLAKQSSGKNIALYYCANCSGSPLSGAQTWTFGEAHRALVTMDEFYGVSTSAALDVTGTATSGSDATRLIGYTGLTGNTAAANELAFGAVMVNAGVDVFETWTIGITGECSTGGGSAAMPMVVGGFNEAFAGVNESLGLVYGVTGATASPYCISGSWGDPMSSYRGAIATFTN